MKDNTKPDPEPEEELSQYLLVTIGSIHGAGQQGMMLIRMEDLARELQVMRKNKNVILNSQALILDDEGANEVAKQLGQASVA